MLGATDTRYYKPITDTVLLFTGHVHDNRWVLPIRSMNTFLWTPPAGERGILPFLPAGLLMATDGTEKNAIFIFLSPFLVVD